MNKASFWVKHKSLYLLTILIFKANIIELWSLQLNKKKKQDQLLLHLENIQIALPKEPKYQCNPFPRLRNKMHILISFLAITGLESWSRMFMREERSGFFHAQMAAPFSVGDGGRRWRAACWLVPQSSLELCHACPGAQSKGRTWYRNAEAAIVDK